MHKQRGQVRAQQRALRKKRAQQTFWRLPKLRDKQLAGYWNMLEHVVVSKSVNTIRGASVQAEMHKRGLL